MKEYIRIWVTLKRVTYKIRSACGPLIRDHENWLRIGGLDEIGIKFWVLWFGGNVREGEYT
jgi:hypothetical protein